MRAKKPTRRQKILISSWGLNPANWLVVRTMPGEVLIEHRWSSKQRVVKERKALREIDDISNSNG